MGTLRYRTRGDSSPSGKPRVYFTCQPDDFPVHFERIVQDILSVQNCAIWYADPTEDDEGASPADLDQMQLFVIPITYRFLHTDNHARLHDLPYALAHNKPVLPIAMEPGLFEDFGILCGDLQLVDSLAADATMQPYEERIRAFLQAVLVGDEMAARVRDAFDTYIFLSYRKKDRAYAQRLMRRIHEKEFCRDIAIWYDEFLVPGESFNDAISRALRTSPLFALTVTPSVLEFNDQGVANYVMSTEYPMARDDGKRVLPFEMTATDQEVLSRLFPGIAAGSCIDPYDDEAFEEALKKALNELALTPSPKDALHNFCIGLAYLAGIDVEVDYDRASELISSAADAGLPEAIEKLVAMLRYGEGVKRDYEQAIGWQRRLVQSRSDLYAQDGSDENGSAYVAALTDLANQLLEVRSFDEAERACEDIRSLCYPLQGRCGWAFAGLSWAFNKQGELNRMRGRTDLAKAYLEKDIEVLRAAMAEQPDDPASLRHLGVALNNAGRSWLAERDTGRAIGYFVEALEAFERIDAMGSTTRSRRDISCTLGYLGNCHYLDGNAEGARVCFERMNALNKSLRDELGTPESIRDYAVSQSKLGLLHMMQGDPEGALVHIREQVALTEDLRNMTESYESLQDLATSYDYAHEAYEALGDLTSTHRFAELYVRAAEQLAETRPCLDATRALRKSHSGLGEIQANLGLAQEARASMQRAIEAGEETLRQTGSAADAHALSTIYYNQGMVTGERGFYRQAYDLWKRLRRMDARYAQYVDMAKRAMRRW